MPTTLNQMSTASGKSVFIDSHTAGGANLSDHYNNTAATTKIASANWDYVVLQEQSQMIAYNPAFTSFYFGKLSEEIIHAHNSCTEVIAFMTWARKEGNNMYTANYTYADMVNDYENYFQSNIFPAQTLGRISPVGAAFHQATIDGYNVYSSDGSHPSALGSYLAACVFYATIFKESPVGNTYSTLVDAATTLALQQLATDIVLNNTYEYWIDKVDFTISASNIDEGQSIDFAEYYWYGGAVPQFDWIFEGGNPSIKRAETATVNYLNAGVYDVTLTVLDECGYIESRTKQDVVTVNALTSILDKSEGEYSLFPTVGTVNSRYQLTPVITDVTNWKLYNENGAEENFSVSNDGLLKFNVESGNYYFKNVQSGQVFRLLINQ